MASFRNPTPDHPENDGTKYLANAKVRKSRYSVENHPRYDELVRDIIACQKPFAQICREYRVPVETLRTYQRTVLADAIRDAGREKARKAISEGLEEVNRSVKLHIKNKQRTDIAQLVQEHRNNLVLYGNIHGVIGQSGVQDPLNPQSGGNVIVDLRQINAFPDMCDYEKVRGVAPGSASDLVMALSEAEEGGEVEEAEWEVDSAEEFENEELVSGENEDEQEDDES